MCVRRRGPTKNCHTKHIHDVNMPHAHVSDTFEHIFTTYFMKYTHCMKAWNTAIRYTSTQRPLHTCFERWYTRIHNLFHDAHAFLDETGGHCIHTASSGIQQRQWPIRRHRYRRGSSLGVVYSHTTQHRTRGAKDVQQFDHLVGTQSGKRSGARGSVFCGQIMQQYSVRFVSECVSCGRGFSAEVLWN
jgi:hypothetical protein